MSWTSILIWGLGTAVVLLLLVLALILKAFWGVGHFIGGITRAKRK